jgi:hypothetical protein
VIEKEDLVNTLHLPLKAAGFKKRSLSWYLYGRDTIVVVNLQRSDWNKDYYINIGIWLKALGDETFPKYYKCPMVWRVEELFPKERELIITGCDLEKSDLDMLNELSAFIKAWLIPFLLDCVDEEKIKNHLIIGTIVNKKILHHIKARQYFFPENEPG